jgi:hypothetical protein
MPALLGVRVVDGAHQGDPVHLPSEARQQLADVDAGDTGVDRPELAADVVRRVGLGVEEVVVAGGAGVEDQDD